MTQWINTFGAQLNCGQRRRAIRSDGTGSPQLQSHMKSWRRGCQTRVTQTFGVHRSRCQRGGSRAATLTNFRIDERVLPGKNVAPLPRIGRTLLSFERASPEQRRDRFLRLAEKARHRALEAPATAEVLLQVAESWDLMARSAMELPQLRAGASYATTYRRVKVWFRQNIGHLCCDNCLGFHVVGNESGLRNAVCRLAREEGVCRYVAVCDYCGEKRTVTRASPNAL